MAPKTAARKPRVGKRRRSREMAIQMLYQVELGEATLPQIFLHFRLADYGHKVTGTNVHGEKKRQEDEIQRAFKHAKKLVKGTVDHQEEINSLIKTQAAHWRMERMPAVDRNILRLAVYEMLHESEVPKHVVLDEAIELAKKFGSERSSRFVNGLLDGLLKNHEFPGRLK